MEEDYPKTLLEMEEQFATGEACRDYLTRLRWGAGFTCPACGGKVGWADHRHRWSQRVPGSCRWVRATWATMGMGNLPGSAPGWQVPSAPDGGNLAKLKWIKV